MKRGFTPEQIIKKLSEAEVLLSKGEKVEQVIRKLGVSDVTYYRWRKEYGGMQVEQAKKYKDLERENARLKKLVADLSTAARQPFSPDLRVSPLAEGVRRET